MSKRKNNAMEDNAAEQANVNEEQQGHETENNSSNDANSSSTESSQNFESKLKEQEDKFLRLYAEFENYRRRSSREKAEYLSGASREMIMAMLPILDDFERAIKNNEQVTDVAILK